MPDRFDFTAPVAGSIVRDLLPTISIDRPGLGNPGTLSSPEDGKFFGSAASLRRCIVALQPLNISWSPFVKGQSGNVRIILEAGSN